MHRTVEAIGFRRYGGAEALEPLDVPLPTLTLEAVLIRVAAGINPADCVSAAASSASSPV